MRNTFVERARPEDFSFIAAFSRRHIGGDLAAEAVIAAVQAHNPESIWVLKDQIGGEIEPAGFSASLLLNAVGLQAFADGRLDTLAPDLAHLAAAGEKPAACYVWAIVAPRRADEMIRLIMQATDRARHEGVPVLGRPATSGGLRLAEKYGFGARAEGEASGALGADTALNWAEGVPARA